METVFRSYLSLFLTLILVVVAISLIMTTKVSNAAISFKGDVIEELEVSHFAPDVITGCEKEASDKGYGILITPLTDARGNTVSCEVIVRYTFEVPLIDVSVNQETKGFAR